MPKSRKRKKATRVQYAPVEAIVTAVDQVSKQPVMFKVKTNKNRVIRHLPQKKS